MTLQIVNFRFSWLLKSLALVSYQTQGSSIFVCKYSLYLIAAFEYDFLAMLFAGCRYPAYNIWLYLE